MSDPQAQFHDPELKAAIIRLRGGHRASDALRAKVQQRVAEARAADAGAGNGDQPSGMRLTNDNPEELRTRRRPWYTSVGRLAIAALVLIAGGIGIAAYMHHLHELEEKAEYLALNRTLLESMIAQSQHAPATPTAVTDPKTLSAELSKTLGREVPVVDLKGWQVQSAGISKLGDATVAQFQLKKGTENLTVFSMPLSAFKYEEGYEEYDYEVNGRALAGYVGRGGVHCVVCDPGVSVEQAKAYIQTIRGS